MTKLSFYSSLIFCLIFSNAVISSANTEEDLSDRFPSPRLRSDYQQADRYIRSIIHQHEAEFPGAMRYDSIFYYTDLKRVSRVQQAVLSEFFQKPGYVQDVKNREPMTDLEVTVRKTTELGNVPRFDDRAWESFKFDVARHIEDVFRKNSLGKKVGQAHIDALLKELSKEEKMTSFATSYSKKRIAKTLAAVLFAQAALKQRPGIKKKALLGKVKDLGVGSLDYLEDDLFFMPVYERFKNAPKEEKKVSTSSFSAMSARSWSPKPKSLIKKDDLKEQTHMALEAIQDLIYPRSLPMTLEEGQKITIREVHPNMAIFRGYVGNDCSTSFSPGFVLTPYDRYYYIFDEEGISLGYVGISVVTLEGEKAFYLHTIQGPDLTSEQTNMVMRAFAKVADVFGASQVMLSKDSNIDSNVNFMPIVAAMQDAVSEATPVSVEWHDHDYRETIVKWGSTRTYDDPNRNDVGRVLQFESPEAIDVKVSQYPFEARFNRPGVIDFKPSAVQGFGGGDYGFSSSYSDDSDCEDIFY